MKENVIKLEEVMDAIKIFSPFEIHCEARQSKRKRKRRLFAVTSSFNMFVKMEFNIFIFFQTKSLEDLGLTLF
jgi:hypothetical protein